MSKTLVLAEKPSVGRELARVLKCSRKSDGCLIGDKYIVTWALGHLVTLADPEAFKTVQHCKTPAAKLRGQLRYYCNRRRA